MKLSKKLLMPLLLIALQPIFIQTLGDAEIDQSLVDHYKTDAGKTEKEKYSSWYHNVFNHKQHKAAKEAQNQLNNAEVIRLKDDNDARQQILNKKKILA